MDLQNGNNSLVTTQSQEPNNSLISVTATNPTSSPESTGDYIASPQVIPYFNQFGGLMVMVPSQEVVPPSNQTPPPSSPPQQDMLTLLRHQIEYYFSKDNLATDKYLLSQMDGDHFVPISVLANFNQVKRLSSDVNLIIEAVKESNSLQLDPTNTKIRAIPEKRCILILREIPKETPKESVFMLFKGEGCPNFISCDFAENDCWYVTFCSEDEAQQAYKYLREEVREFLGKPIRARIKNTAVQRTSSLPKPRPQQFPYSNVQPMSYYQQPLPWSPFFTDQSFAATASHQYANGYPPPSPFGPPPPGGNRFVMPPNPSMVSTGATTTGGGGTVSRDTGRKGSTGGGGGGGGGTGRGRHSVYTEGGGGTDRKSTNNSGGGNSNRENHRYRRNDEDRDRNRNLPNRFKNKRNEESLASGGNTSEKKEEKGEKPVLDKDKQGPYANRQRGGPNRTQPKIDLAPNNFPPLPGQVDLNTVPPSPPLPSVVSDEGKAKLADIVKGCRGNGDKPLVSSPGADTEQPLPPQSPPPSVSTNSAIATVPPVAKAIPSSVPPSNQTATTKSTKQVSTTTTTVTVTSSSKDQHYHSSGSSNNNNNHKVQLIKSSSSSGGGGSDKQNVVRSTQSMSRGGNGNNKGSRYRSDGNRYDSSKKPTNSARQSQVLSPKGSSNKSSSASSNQVPPTTTPAADEDVNDKSDEGPTRRSYAQIITSQKPIQSPVKSSSSSSDIKSPSSPSHSLPGNSQLSGACDTTPPSPPSSPVQSDVTSPSLKN